MLAAGWESYPGRLLRTSRTTASVADVKPFLTLTSAVTKLSLNIPYPY